LRMGDEPTTSLVPFLLNDQIWEYVNDLVCSTSSINDDDNLNQDLQVYPNPTNEQLTVKIKDIRLGNISICNQLGLKVMEITSNESLITLNVSALAEGVYFIKQEGFSKIQRFVKSKK
jgi:hypothetical protein